MRVASVYRNLDEYVSGRGQLWHYPLIGRDLATFLAPYEVRPPAEQQDEVP